MADPIKEITNLKETAASRLYAVEKQLEGFHNAYGIDRIYEVIKTLRDIQEDLKTGIVEEE